MKKTPFKNRNFLLWESTSNAMSSPKRKYRERLLTFRKTVLSPILFSGLSLVLLTPLFTACGCGSPTQPTGADNASLTVTNHVFFIAENVPTNTLVGIVNTSDESGITNFAISGSDSDAFAISSNGGLTTATNLDYETKSNYSFIVRVSDVNGSSSTNITVNVTNVDDAPPVITNHIFSVAENVPTNTLVGIVNTSDEDGITNFAIIAGNNNGVFAINSNGRLTTIGIIDHDTTSIYSLIFKVVDGKGYSNTNTISVIVIPDTMPPSITNHVFTVAENATSGSEVGIVQASDDSGVTNFAITAGNINVAFAINSNGTLTTATNLDYGINSNYSLTVEVADSEGNTSNGIVSIMVIDILEWQNRYITNAVTNDLTIAETTVLNESTIIDGLKGKMFAWLDVSISPLLIINSNNRLTNWLDKKSYVITETNMNTTLSVTTNTNSQIQIISNERVAFTNIVTSTNITLSLILTNAISATPKSDVSGNDSLSFQAGSNGYVDVDYEGSDRVGLAIDTTSMGNSDNVTAFYLVTEWVRGNNSFHIPLGYNNLGNGERFFTKKASSSEYIATNGNDAKGNIVLGESTLERNTDFAIPSTLHLISRRGLAISKSALNGIIGSFPNGNGNGGNQRIRELIIFTNNVTNEDHSNIVKYLYDKWQLPRKLLTTNLISYYSHEGNNVINNAIDGSVVTYFKANNSVQQNFVNNRVLFESRLYGSVLDGGVSLSSSVNGLSAGHNSLYLRTGLGVPSDAIKASFRVEIYRTNDDNWFVLSNVTIDTNSGDKIFLFSLDHASNDFTDYRLVANGPAPSVENWFIINEFRPSESVADSTTTPPTISNHTFSIRENVSAIVGMVNGVDDGVIVSYAITAGNSNTSFEIDNDGLIRSFNIIDYERISNYMLTIRATDEAGNSGTGSVTINVIDGIDLTNITNVPDGGDLLLDGAISVATAEVEGTNYLFVAGADDDGVSMFSVGSDGSFINITNVFDAGDLELDEPYSVVTAEVGGTTYLFVAGREDGGVSVFLVENNGSLINVANIPDGGDLELYGARSVATAEVGGTNYLFVAGYYDHGLSVFSIESNGSLINVANVPNMGDLNLYGPSAVTTAVIEGATYLFVTRFDYPYGAILFSVGNNGSLNKITDVPDGGDLAVSVARSVTTAEVGGTTYLFIAGKDDDGVSVFSVRSNGSLINVYNVSDSDGGDLELEGASSVSTVEIGGTTHLFVAGRSDDGVSVFSVGSDGSLTNVYNVSNGGDLELEGASSVSTVEIGGTTYLFVAGRHDNGISVFKLDVP